MVAGCPAIPIVISRPVKETSTVKLFGLIAVPVYNEAAVLPAVIENLKSVLVDFPVVDLIFINDGSADQSVAILQQAGMEFISHPTNLGYKEALRTAMVWTLKQNYDFVVFFDSDGQHRIEDLIKIIGVHQSSGEDLIIGSRYQDDNRSGFSFRKWGTSLFSWLATRFTGVKVTDVTCGLKLIHRTYLPIALNLPTEDFHAELIVGLARSGASISEVGIVVPDRMTGSSMYNIYDSILYPARTMICLIGGLLFSNRLKPVRSE